MRVIINIDCLSVFKCRSLSIGSEEVDMGSVSLVVCLVCVSAGHFQISSEDVVMCSVSWFLECVSVFLSGRDDRSCVNNLNSVVSKSSDVFSELHRGVA